MRFLPIFLDLTSGAVVLVGSGEPAVNKLRLLAAAGARVRWHVDAHQVPHARATAAEIGASVALETGDPLSADWSDAAALISAAGRARDDAVAARARAMRIPVNVVDRPDLSTFIMPAIVDRGDVVVAIGTGGAAPVLARRLRERIEALLPARIGELASLMQRYRERVGAKLAAFSERRRFWQRTVDGPIADAVYAGRMHDAEAALIAAIDDARHADRAVGTVFLVGAGPGDPDLLTLRALHALQDADVVFYDELVTPAIIDRARRDAERVFVGKRRGQPGIGQAEINRRLVEAASDGKHVVRLKSGDPFVFGRGGEELEHLREAGVPVVVVPGITAALGCAAEAGLPLTFRSEASRLTFVTAHRADEAAAIDWSGLADATTTVVVYMGLASAAAVRDGLIAAGRDAATPARGSGARHAAGCPCGARPARRIVHPRGVGRRRSRAPHDRRGGGALDRVARRAGAARRATGGRMTSPHEQKLRIKGPVVVTANRLTDGAVIYRTAVGGWTTDLAAAAVVTTAPAAQDLLKGAVADDVGAVGSYVAPVELTPDRRVLPGNLRERIRFAGPTIDLPVASL